MAKTTIFNPFTGTLQRILDEDTLSFTVDNIEQNIILNAYRIAILGSFSVLNMVDGIVDAYIDETGINTGASVDQEYDSVNDLYSPRITGTPIAHYKMNDSAASTTVIDSSTNGHDGVSNVNTNTYSTTGQINEALNFQASEFITIADDPDFDVSDKLSVIMWTNLNAVANNRNFVSKYNTSGNNREWLFAITGISGSQAKLKLNLSSDGAVGTTAVCTTDNLVVTTSTWHNIGFTYNAGTVKIYVDGVSVPFTVTNASIPTTLFNGTQHIEIGAVESGFDKINGKLDSIYIFDSELSQSDIDILYNSGSGTEDTDAVSLINDMTLLSTSFTAQSEPDNAALQLIEEDVDSITLNTDLIVSVSRDGGTTFTSFTLEEQDNLVGSQRVLTANGSISSQPAGTSMVYKIQTANNKDMKFYSSSLSWD